METHTKNKKRESADPPDPSVPDCERHPGSALSQNGPADASGRVRLTCSTCGRMVGWTASQATQTAPVSAPFPAPITEPRTDPPHDRTWIYVSRRLDVLELSPTAMLGPVVAFGTVPHYRLTPNTFAWFQAAGLALATAAESDSAKASDYREYTRVMRRLATYACEQWNDGQMADAKPELPDPPWCPMQ